MTYLEAVNAVLIRLRQSQVSSVNENEYSLLIGQFVNEAKNLVEDSWNWSVLRTDVTVSATVGTQDFTLTGTNPRTRILDAYNTTQKIPLGQENLFVLRELYNISTTTGAPSRYAVVGLGTSDALKVKVYPSPNVTSSLSFNCVIPQAALSSNNTTISVPSEPIVQIAYLKAINERGEDQGRLSEIQDRIATQVLADAIGIDAYKYEAEITWQAI